MALNPGRATNGEADPLNLSDLDTSTIAGVPAVTVDSVAVEGSSGQFIETDATLAIFNDGTPPAAVAAAANTGNAQAAARRDHVHTITGGISVQKINVSSGGTLVGTRQSINIIDGGGLTITVTDNPGANRVDITFSVP